MGDNDLMNDRDDTKIPPTIDDSLERLSQVDPAVAPELAEELADRLARELDSTAGSGVTETGHPS